MYLTNGSYVKGYNEQGNLVIIFDNYGQYAAIEYSKNYTSNHLYNEKISSIYDKFGRVAYSAAIVPISGFSNASTSAGLDYKNEGFILGICSNVLKLSGVVLTMASFVGVVFGIIKYLINL